MSDTGTGGRSSLSTRARLTLPGWARVVQAAVRPHRVAPVYLAPAMAVETTTLVRYYEATVAQRRVGPPLTAMEALQLGQPWVREQFRGETRVGLDVGEGVLSELEREVWSLLAGGRPGSR